MSSESDTVQDLSCCLILIYGSHDPVALPGTLCRAQQTSDLLHMHVDAFLTFFLCGV